MNGHLALKHAMEERNRVQDKWPHPLQMEDYLVKASLQKLKLVIRKAAQSTVNGDLMKPGRLARKHVGAVKEYEQDKLTYQHRMEDKRVMEMPRKQKFAIRTSVQSTVNGDLMVNGPLALKVVVEALGAERDRNWLKKLMVDRALGMHR